VPLHYSVYNVYIPHKYCDTVSKDDSFLKQS
jgi:hypothetical protein